MKPLNAATLERILAVLPAEDADELLDALEPPWKLRQRRLLSRDQAVRQAIDLHYRHLPLLTAAKGLSRALDRHLSSRWPDDPHPAEGDSLRACLARIAHFNDGAGLAPRSIWRAAKISAGVGSESLVSLRDEA